MRWTEYCDRSDEELVDLSRRGDDRASECLMERYKDLVRRQSRSLYLQGGDKDDLLQEGMLGLFKALRGYRAEKGASFHTFAVLCIRRQLYNAVETSSREKHQPLNTACSIDAPFTMENEEREGVRGAEGISAHGSRLSRTLATDSQNPEKQCIDQENRKDLETSLQEVLSPMEKTVLELYLQDLSYVEIAERLSCDPKSADNALQRIKSKVRKLINA